MPILPRRPELVVWVCIILAGCGGGGGGGGAAPPPAPPPSPAPQAFSIGGTVSGLDAVGLVLQNNGGPDLAISANGLFSFPEQLASGSAYSVTIKTQPNIGPVQLCSVTNGSGTVGSGAVTNVAIACVSRVFKFLYVISTTLNELRGYSINASDGTLTALPGPPVPTGTAPGFPVPDPAGRFLYLGTRGSSSEPPRISVYAADNVTGALSEIDASPYDLSTPPPPPGALAVLPPSIHRSGAFGYLPVLTPASTLYGATIDATTGELTQIPGMPINLGSNMSGMTYDSTGGYLFVPTNGANANGEIRSFSVNVPSGVLTPIGSFSTYGSGPVGAFFTPGGNYLLTTNINSGTLMVFGVNGGTLTPLTAPPLATGPAGSRPVGIMFNRRNNVFYTTHIAGGPTSVATFRFDPGTGGVTPVGTPVSTNGAGAGVSLHPSGRFLFQYNSTTASIQRFALDQATGAPTLVPDVTQLPSAPTQVAMILDLSGRFLYVTNSAATAVSSYSIDASTGALTLINSAPTSAGGLTTLPFLVQ